MVNGQGTDYAVALVPGTSRFLSGRLSGDGVGGAPCNDPAMQFTPTCRTRTGPASSALPGRAGPLLRPAELRDLRPHLGSPGPTGRGPRLRRAVSPDVANDSGSLSSPFAVTSQYADNASLTSGSPFLVTGRALNNSKYGGGCIDYGVRAVRLRNAARAPAQGDDYPGTDAMGSCYVSGPSAPPCLTDSDIQGEVTAIGECDTARPSCTAWLQSGCRRFDSAQCRGLPRLRPRTLLGECIVARGFLLIPWAGGRHRLRGPALDDIHGLR